VADGQICGRYQGADGGEHRPEVEAVAAASPVAPGSFLDRAVGQDIAGRQEGEASG
jgi:hypothetical protein